MAQGHILDEKERTADILIQEDLTFNSLFLPNNILQGLKEFGFHRPSPIQLKAIPLGRCGLDLIVKAKSGTGKTVVFTVLALETVSVATTSPQVIILAPTREIAVQIQDVAKSLGKYVEHLNIECFIGGLPIEDDIKKIKTCHIVIGAPGRVKALIEKKVLKTKAVRLLVLDEVDKLMEESFQADINYIYNSLPQQKQVLAISATYPDELAKLLNNYMHSPTFVSPNTDSPLLLGLQQFVAIVKEHRNVMQQIDIKTKELIRLLSNISFTQCIVFFNFQTRAETLSHLLKQHGWNAMYISGSQPQTERLKVITSLKKFECRVLLTTDLTARGIDASNVNLVINYEVPFKAVTYLHRMGRAGRYGAHGICVTISSDTQELCEFQKIIGHIGGSKFSVPKVPDMLDNIWTCNINDLEKIQSLIDDTISSDLKQSVVDLKSVYNNLRKLKVVDETIDNIKTKDESDIKTKDESDIKTKDESDVKSSDVDDQECVSANILYPWVPVDTNVLSKPLGDDLLLETLTPELVKKRKATDDSSDESETLSKNIALYNTAQLITSSNLNFNENLAVSVDKYLNVLQEKDKQREKEMEKFFESYSADDLLKNLAEHTDAWSKADCTEEPTTSAVSADHNAQENIFKISFDYMLKNTKHWMEFINDYCSSEDEIEAEDDPQKDSSIAEALCDVDSMDSNIAAPVNNYSYWSDGFTQDDYRNIPLFKQMYDKCSEDMDQCAGNFINEASANEWYDNWRIKVSSVTNYVQQNIETYEKGQYQHSMYYNN